MRTKLHKSILILTGCILAPALLAGCGNYQTQFGGDDYKYEPHAVAISAPVSGSPVDTTTAAAKDPLLKGGDPMLKTENPMTKETSGFGHESSFAAKSDPLLSNENKTEGWYWLVGSIQSGTIAVAVNGVPIGRFTVHIDQEITKFCHPGINTLTFTHYPNTPDSTVCPLHLQIMNGHAQKGSPPLMVYDTMLVATDDAAQTPATTPGIDTSTADTSTAPSFNPVATMPKGPFTETRDFLGQ